MGPHFHLQPPYDQRTRCPIGSISSSVLYTKHKLSLLSLLPWPAATPRCADSLQSIVLTFLNLYALFHEETDISYDDVMHPLT